MRAVNAIFLNKAGKPIGGGTVYDIGGGKAVRHIKTEVLESGSKRYTLQFGRFIPRECINEGA